MNASMKAIAARIIVVTAIAAGGAAALSSVAVAESATVPATVGLISAHAPVSIQSPAATLHGNTPWG